MKKSIVIGTALAFMLSAGVTVSAGHHMSCVGRVIQGSNACWNGEYCDSEYHWLRHNSGQGCGFWGVDIQGTYDRWASCHGVYESGTTYEPFGAEDATGNQPAGALTQEQSGGNTATQSQEAGEPAVEQEVQPPVQPAVEAPAAGTYNGEADNWGGYGNQTSGYYNGGYYGGGCHTSGGRGHHGSGHHGHH